MAEFVTVAKVSEFVPGKGRLVPVTGKTIAVYKLDGEFFAIDDSCPHRGGSLAEGGMDGCIVHCPWHGYRFDVKTGMNADGMPYSVHTYPVRVEGENVQIQI